MTVIPNLVSVIVPCHNRPSLLCDCLNSVNNQTYRPLEVLVADDCSCEPLKPVCQEINWNTGITVNYLRREANGGPGAARETGRLQAQGEFICYLDSDDMWASTFVERNVQNLRQHPQADLSYCDCIIFTEWPITGEPEIRQYRDKPIHKLLPESFYVANWITNSARMWTRRATDKIAPWLESFRSQDVNYTLRAGCLDITVCFWEEALAYYRRAHGQEQITQDNGIHGRVEQAKPFLDAKRHLQEHGKLDDKRNALPFARLLFEMAKNLLLLGETEYATYYLQAVTEIAGSQSRIGISGRLTRQAIKIGSPYNAGRLARRLSMHVVNQ